MKILQVIDSLSMGGAENLITQLSICQRLLGHQVHVLALCRPNTKKLVEKLNAAGVQLVQLPGSCVYNPLLIRKIAKYIKNFDVVHVHLFPALYMVALAKKLFGIRTPVIYTEHSTQNKRRTKKLWHFFDEMVYDSYDAVVACADKVSETFKRDFPHISIETINNGIDTSVVTSAEPYDKGLICGRVYSDVFVLCMVARFCYPKMQNTVVEALRYLPSNVHAVFVGGGESGIDKSKAFSKQIAVQDRVHFLGIRSDVPQLLQTADVVVASSEYEGLSLASIEGMASGKPFVASDVPGLKEVVSGAGELFPCGDSRALADIVLKLMKDKEYYSVVSNRCLERARNYDINKTTEQYLSLYARFVLPGVTA